MVPMMRPSGRSDAVVDQGVGEHEAEERRSSAAIRQRALAPQGERRRERGGQDQHQHAGGVGTALRLDVGAEDQRDHDVDGEQHEDQRPRERSPARRHAEARQVARDEVQEPRHGRRAREAEDQDRRDVVDGAEARPEVPVGQEGDRAPGGLAALLVIGRGDEQRRDEAREEQHHAHDPGRGRAAASGCWRRGPAGAPSCAGCGHGPSRRRRSAASRRRPSRSRSGPARASGRRGGRPRSPAEKSPFAASAERQSGEQRPGGSGSPRRRGRGPRGSGPGRAPRRSAARPIASLKPLRKTAASTARIARVTRTW